MKIYSIKLKFEPRDMWIGLYWNNSVSWMEYYICIIPCFPICIKASY